MSKLRKPFVFIGIALLCNLLFFHFGLETVGVTWDMPVQISGDASDYVESTENLIKGDGFTFFKTSEDKAFISNFAPESFSKPVFYAFRSPGFAFFYLPLRLIFSQSTSLLLLLFLQVILTAVAKYCLARTAEMLTGSKAAFLIAFLMACSTPYFTQYNNLLLTEAFAFSFLVFFIFFLLKAQSFKSHVLNNKSYWLYFTSGLFLTIAIMLRPFLAMFLPFAGMYLMVQFVRSYKTFFKIGIAFYLPFIICNGLWTIRNYVHTDQLIPLAATLAFQDHKHQAVVPMRNFSKQKNLSDRWFDSGSPVFWLVTKADTRALAAIDTSLSMEESLFFEKVKKDFHKSLDTLNFNLQERRLLEEQVVTDIKEYNSAFVDGYPLKVNVVNPLKSTLGLLNQPNMRFFHHIQYPFNVALVFWQSFILKAIMYFGVITLFFNVLLSFRFNKIWMVIAPSCLGLVFYFGFLEQTIEYRELYTFSGLSLLSIVVFLFNLKAINKVVFYGGSAGFLIGGLILAYVQTLTEINW